MSDRAAVSALLAQTRAAPPPVLLLPSLRLRLAGHVLTGDLPPAAPLAASDPDCPLS